MTIITDPAGVRFLMSNDEFYPLGENSSREELARKIKEKTVELMLSKSLLEYGSIVEIDDENGEILGYCKIEEEGLESIED